MFFKKYLHTKCFKINSSYSFNYTVQYVGDNEYQNNYTCSTATISIVRKVRPLPVYMILIILYRLFLYASRLAETHTRDHAHIVIYTRKVQNQLLSTVLQYHWIIPTKKTLHIEDGGQASL